MITEEIRKFVEDECRKPSSKYGFEPYETHFVSMVKYSLMLAENSNVDKEVVEIAAWLHDIGSIIHGRENHHITGAKIAEEKLTELEYDPEKIELVKKCILNHRGSVSGKRESNEEQLIADADGMTMFDRLEGVFMAAFVYENLGQIEARMAVRKKMINSYNKLSEDAKIIIKPKFEAAMLLFS
ncbi:MAG: HD domain-containing protein [Nanoarchaeota archaeon]